MSNRSSGNVCHIFKIDQYHLKISGGKPKQTKKSEKQDQQEKIYFFTNTILVYNLDSVLCRICRKTYLSGMDLYSFKFIVLN